MYTQYILNNQNIYATYKYDSVFFKYIHFFTKDKNRRSFVVMPI